MFGDFLENDIIKFSILRKYLSPRIKIILDISSKNAKTYKLHSFSKKMGWRIKKIEIWSMLGRKGNTQQLNLWHNT